MAESSPKPVVMWTTLNYPPWEIASGPLQDKGILDLFRKDLVAHLPQFHHELQAGITSERRESLLRRRMDVCELSMIETPKRLRYTVFTRRKYQILAPPRLIGERRDMLALDNAGRAVNLAQMMESGGLRLGLLAGRSYGVDLDAQLATLSQHYPDRVLMLKTTSESGLGGLIQHLKHKRIDLTIGYSYEAETVRRSDPDHPNLAFLPIQGVAKPLVIGISCADTAIGRQVVNAIDALPANAMDFWQVERAYEAMLPPEERRWVMEQAAQHLHPVGGVKDNAQQE
ncbi:hypothetical protein KSF73_10390 [Burkholderiaceae bacterium DAT-1]|nr:hypothetical protein [Burkholderiaceae bacterium DAT-1]